ncbi:hypothetical protein GGX14DRAFT_379412 [Mycena pura]|uniref:Uncharacterized protein n=1 Tax=Mycena pura TaxID=153505 RepID=A0AAD6UVY6_9AGAR|nr:hypothetical protein GGX14DRAFT_379412 [Mycena pura]
MVRLSRAFFVLSLFAASLSTPNVVTEAHNDITQKIRPQINTLKNDVSGFPASGLTAIHSDVQTLVSTVIAATEDIDIENAGSYGFGGGIVLLADIQGIMPTLFATFVNLGVQKNAFAAVSGGQALILSDLQSLNTSFSNYLDTLKGVSPFRLKLAWSGTTALITGGFTTAIAEYSS